MTLEEALEARDECQAAHDAAGRHFFVALKRPNRWGWYLSPADEARPMQWYRITGIMALSPDYPGAEEFLKTLFAPVTEEDRVADDFALCESNLEDW